MSQNLLVPAGELLEFRCPQGTIALGVGSRIELEGQLVAIVLESEGGLLRIAPYKAGVFSLDPFCSPSQGLGFYEVSLPDEQNFPKLSPPLGPFSLSIPFLYWLFLIGFILSILAFVFALRAWSKRKTLMKLAKAPKAPIPPHQRMAAFLAEPLTEGMDASGYFAEGVKRCRQLIQNHMNFAADGATRREFLGEVKARKASSAKVNTKLIAQLEAVFLMAEDVSFANTRPPKDVVDLFRKRLTDIYEVLKP